MPRLGLLALGLLLATAGCVVVDDGGGSRSSGSAARSADIAGQEQACASEFADRLGIDMDEVRVQSRDTAPSGNPMIFVSTADDDRQGRCEVDSNYDVVDFDM